MKTLEEAFQSIFIRPEKIKAIFQNSISTEESGLLYIKSQTISPLNSDNGFIDKELFIGFDENTFCGMDTEDLVSLMHKLGISSSLDHYMLQKSIDLQNSTPNNVRFNINISSSSLNADEEFLSVIINKLSQRVLIPERTVFEITEQTLISNFDSIQLFMREAKSYGAKFSLDDFGSGFASYDYLCELSFDRLKVDGKYIHRMISSERITYFLKSLVYLCSLLDMEIVAEKVETSAQYEKVRLLGFDYAQGYYLQKPQAITTR